MQTKLRFAIIIVLVSIAVTASGQTAAFTYQGRLTDSTLPATGTYQMEFSLWNAASGGVQNGTTITNNAVAVANGVFTVQLDFSGAPFLNGANRWLEIAIRKASDPPGFTTLTPRQPVLGTPFSTRSQLAGNSTELGGIAASSYLQTNGDGSALTNLNGANIANSTITASALAPSAVPTTYNLSLLATLRWDLLRSQSNFAVGNGPLGIAFDGASIWVANSLGNTVTKLRAIDGSPQGTFPVGLAPVAIAFDGTNIWVANRGSDTVTKLRASDGVLQGTYPVGQNPNGIAFDGVNMWVPNDGSATVTKLRASDGSLQGTFSVGTRPSSIAFDGTNIWVVHTSLSISEITRLRASDGSPQGTFSAGTANRGVAFDGANIWITTFSGSVWKLRASDGVVLGNFSVGVSSYGIAFDGKSIWVSTSSGNTLVKLRPSDGVVECTFTVGTQPVGIAFDGTNIWVANQGSNNVTKLQAFP